MMAASAAQISSPATRRAKSHMLDIGLAGIGGVLREMPQHHE